MIDAFGVDVVSKALGPNALAGLGSSATKAGKKIFTNPQANYAADRLAANTAGRSGNVAAGRAARAQSRSGQVDTQIAKPKEYIGTGNYKNLNPQLAYRARAAGIPERAVNPPTTTMGRRKSPFTRNQKIVAGTAVVGGGGVLTASSASKKRQQQGSYISKSWEGIEMHDAFGVERSDISKAGGFMGAIKTGTRLARVSRAGGASMTSSAGRGVAATFKKAPGATLAAGGLAGGGAAFGLGRMSKGFSPAQLEVMTQAGGSFANRANAARAGKSKIIPRDGQYRNVRVGPDIAYGMSQRKLSTTRMPRGTQGRARSSGYRNEYVAPLKGTRGSKFDSVAPNRRVFVNPNSDAAWKLNRAKANGAKFGANNPANRVAKPKRSMASAKSRVRAKLGMKSY